MITEVKTFPKFESSDTVEYSNETEDTPTDGTVITEVPINLIDKIDSITCNMETYPGAGVECLIDGEHDTGLITLPRQRDNGNGVYQTIITITFNTTVKLSYLELYRTPEQEGISIVSDNESPEILEVSAINADGKLDGITSVSSFEVKLNEPNKRLEISPKVGYTTYLFLVNKTKGTSAFGDRVHLTELIPYGVKTVEEIIVTEDSDNNNDNRK